MHTGTNMGKRRKLLEELLDDTMNELSEGAKRVVRLLNETKKRKSSGHLQQNSKSLKLLDVNLESQIEFSDSSDDEE